MRSPRPDCPHCHGGGDRERVHRNASGQTVAFIYEPCSCRYTRTETEEEEDWSNDYLKAQNH